MCDYKRHYQLKSISQLQIELSKGGSGKKKHVEKAMSCLSALIGQKM